MTRSPLAALGICLCLVMFSADASARDARPAKWCGWYARHYLVSSDPGKKYNLARNWARWGRAVRPIPGAIVVWRGHVGKLISHVRGNIWVVKSGNDGRRVRTRPRSITGAIAFRIAD